MTKKNRFPVVVRPAHVAAVSLVALLAACGGGGGGGGGGGDAAAAASPALGSPATTTPALVETVDALTSVVTAPAQALVSQLVPAPASSFETSEYYRNYSLDMINASAAYATGASGQGVVVAVNDGLVDTSVTELAGRIAAGGTNLTGDSTVNQHATHLAGIIAANRNGTGMEGVAWSATILPVASFIAVDGGGNSGDGLAPYNGIAYAARAGADIINNSWGSAVGDPQSADLVAAVRTATGLGAIVVFSTGNAGADQPSTTALVPLSAPETQSRFIAVTAVGSTGVIASYANACGDAAAWCLAAPGSRITSTDAGSGYLSMSGTSMAAAVVSGALAVVTSRFPELTSAQVANRVLVTADSSGIYADADIYGHGLLDLGAATQPIGTLTANAVGSTVATGSLTTGNSASLTGNAVLGDALVHSLSAVPMALFDSFDGATFVGDLGQMVAPGRGLDVGDLAFGDFGTAFFAERSGVPGLSLSLAEQRQDIGAYAALQGQSRDGGETVMMARLALDKTTTLFAGLNASLAGLQPGNDALPYQAGLALSADALVPGALTLADGGVALGLDTALGADWGLTLTLLNKAPNDDFGAAGASAAEARLRFALGGGLTLEGGVAYLREEGEMLGAAGQGLLAIGRAETVQASIGARFALSPDTMLFARYDRAVTRAGNTGALIDSADVASDSWAVGLIGQDAALPGDHWGISAYQPLAGRGGEMVLARPLGRSSDGIVYGDTVAVGLDGGGREVDLEAFYALPVGERGLFGVNLLYVSQPGNSAAAPDEVLGMLRYRQRLW